MHNALSVHVRKCLQDLDEEPPNLLLAQPLVDCFPESLLLTHVSTPEGQDRFRTFSTNSIWIYNIRCTPLSPSVVSVTETEGFGGTAAA